MYYQTLVSIITPCYNAAITIADTIESVVRQTYPNWEMLIVDDYSTDNSAKIIKEYAARDTRIHYLKTETPSGSPSIPRNIGIEYAKGKYIAFLDSDDVWLPDKLEKQLRFMEANCYQMVYSYYEKMDWQGRRNRRVVKTRNKTTYQKLLTSNSIPCLTAMMAHDVIGETRFRQIPQEDFCFWLEILKKGYTAYNLQEITALYRESRDSRSGNKLAMFKGYWNVLRREQHIPFMAACGYMLTYSILGILKYLK